MGRQQRNDNKYSHARSHLRKPLRESFLIFCEGATEVGYFNFFRKRAKLMHGGNALKIVQNSITYKDKSSKKFDQYWVVFDKDETSHPDFNRAIEIAEANGINVAWGNQAFELWFILHYQDFRRECHRNKYEMMLKEYIPWYYAGGKSEEQGRKLHQHTFSLIPVAIQNARNGFESFDQVMPASQKESCTKLYVLIEKILANS
jgi:RloB-like protein